MVGIIHYFHSFDANVLHYIKVLTRKHLTIGNIDFALVGTSKQKSLVATTFFRGAYSSLYLSIWIHGSAITSNDLKKENHLVALVSIFFLLSRRGNKTTLTK